MNSSHFRISSVALLVAAILVLGGCGSSSTTTTPGNTNIFYATSVFLNGTTAKGMGYNGFGQLGDGTTTSRSTAGIIARPGVFNGLVAGGYHTLAFGTYTAWTAGGNGFGQLGRILANKQTQDPVFQKVSFDTFTTVQRPKPGRIVAVAAGGAHSLLTDENGRVWGWGAGGSGQLGNNAAANSTQPVVVYKQSNAGELSLGTTDIPVKRALAAGGSHSLALTNTGEVFAWGNNTDGQVGFPSVAPNFITYFTGAVQVAGLPTVTRIAAGGSFNLALDTTGKVWAWGLNGGSYGRGQLGYDPKTLPVFRDLPLQVAGLPAVADDIAVGLAHAMVRVGGNVYAWGFNGLGQLGDGTKVDRFTPQLVMLNGTTPLSGVTAIRAFGNQSFALANGVWYAWGDNTHGQLGGSTSPLTFALLPLAVSGL